MFRSGSGIVNYPQLMDDQSMPAWVKRVRLISILGALLFSSSSYADRFRDFESDLGLDFIPVFTGSDHFKYGVHFSATAFNTKPWSPWLLLDTGLATFVTVNPGAGSLPTMPTLSQTRGGSVPFLLRALARTPWRGQEFRFDFGLTWYYADLNTISTASIQGAPTVALEWSSPIAQTEDLEIFSGLSYMPLGKGAAIFLPEVALRHSFSSVLALRAAARAPLIRYFGFGGTTFLQPSLSVALVTGF